MRDFIVEIINIVANTKDNEQLIDELNQFHPSDIADAFLELKDEDLLRLYDILPRELLADIITFIEDKERYLELMENEDVAEIVTRKLMVEKLQKVLPFLSEEEQLLIHRHYYEDIPETELAIMYGISQQGISKRILKIREKLKKLLEN